MLDQVHAAWFEEERGITRATLEAFGLHSDGKAVVLPYGPGMDKRRYGIPHGERKFIFSKGIKPPIYHAQDLGKPNVFLCEGESDTMRLWQELHTAGADVGVVGLPGNETWVDQMAEGLAKSDRVYVVLDNDQDYMVQSRTENAWAQIRAALGKKARRVRLPRGCKDICEFFEGYDLDGFRALVTDSSQTSFNYTPMDLTQEPGPIDWMVDGLFCNGDLVEFIGEPGSFKSYLSMALSVAVAQGLPSFAGRKLHLPGEGRVLYVDEENPNGLIPHRMRKLGLTAEGAQKIRYLLRQNVRLDRNPGMLLDEALNWQPDLIVLDSLTRLHTQDENAAGPMAKLFNDGIVPLAREAGATVIILHHVNKGDGNSSFGRSRGTGDIPAAVDCGLDVRLQGPGVVSLALFKSRWKQAGEAMVLGIQDDAEGLTHINPNPEVNF